MRNTRLWWCHYQASAKVQLDNKFISLIKSFLIIHFVILFIFEKLKKNLPSDLAMVRTAVNGPEKKKKRGIEAACIVLGAWLGFYSSSLCSFPITCDGWDNFIWFVNATSRNKWHINVALHVCIVALISVSLIASNSGYKATWQHPCRHKHLLRSELLLAIYPLPWQASEISRCHLPTRAEGEHQV